MKSSNKIDRSKIQYDIETAPRVVCRAYQDIGLEMIVLRMEY